MEEQDLQAFIRKPFTVYLAGAKVELEVIDVRALSASAGARVKAEPVQAAVSWPSGPSLHGSVATASPRATRC